MLCLRWHQYMAFSLFRIPQMSYHHSNLYLMISFKHLRMASLSYLLASTFHSHSSESLEHGFHLQYQTSGGSCCQWCSLSIHPSYLFLSYIRLKHLPVFFNIYFNRDVPSNPR